VRNLTHQALDICQNLLHRCRGGGNLGGELFDLLPNGNDVGGNLGGAPEGKLYLEAQLLANLLASCDGPPNCFEGVAEIFEGTGEVALEAAENVPSLLRYRRTEVAFGHRFRPCDNLRDAKGHRSADSDRQENQKQKGHADGRDDRDKGDEDGIPDSLDGGVAPALLEGAKELKVFHDGIVVKSNIPGVDHSLRRGGYPLDPIHVAFHFRGKTSENLLFFGTCGREALQRGSPLSIGGPGRLGCVSVAGKKKTKVAVGHPTVAKSSP